MERRNGGEWRNRGEKGREWRNGERKAGVKRDQYFNQTVHKQ